jgi:S-adenosylmethionine:tRNA ribosyltransferase-isomerase
MVVDASAPTFQHRRFNQLPDLLRAGDLLVMNDTRVLAARVRAHRASGGAVELLFVAPEADDGRGDTPDRVVWRALVRPAKRVRVGDVLDAHGTALQVVSDLEAGQRGIAFPPSTDVPDWLRRHGVMPLPPYIDASDGEARRLFDQDRYQTVYAREPGAVAAPTAGLHFTQALLDDLRARGIKIAFLTLAVGPGTFRPVTATEVGDHTMDGESYCLPAETAAAVNGARSEGRRVIAVGTTSVRALEHAASIAHRHGGGDAGSGAGAPQLAATRDSADIFITPGYRFRVVDAMITNLHLPRSTPILLAAAVVGRERLLAAYVEAIEHRYRFYSYGDAMLLQ